MKLVGQVKPCPLFRQTFKGHRGSPAFRWRRKSAPGRLGPLHRQLRRALRVLRDAKVQGRLAEEAQRRVLLAALDE